MPTLQITLTVPEGTTVSIAGLESATISPPEGTGDAVRRYWRHYLSDNSRKIYAAAARIEDVHGPGFTLEDIAQNISLGYDSAKSLHRTSGRTEKRWREETHSDPPIRLEEIEYADTAEGTGRRTRYRLPRGVAEVVMTLPLVSGRGGED